MAEEKNTSLNKETDYENKNESEKEKKERNYQKLDSYDQILLDTFPASDSVAKY